MATNIFPQRRIHRARPHRYERFRVAAGVLVLFPWLWTAGAQRTWAEDPQPIEIAEQDRAEPVDFEKEVLPILRKNCLACHNTTDAKSDLVLETPQTIQKGGSQGPVVVPGQSGKSLILQVASHQAEPIMPPADNDRGAGSLTPDELGLLARWIDEGAEGTVTGPERLAWQPIPDTFQPIFAAAISDDGQYAACGRANRLYIYHLPTGQLVTQLVDPDVSISAGPDDLRAAHLDMVQSLAFNPTGDLLASGGFRTVKLWRRPRNVRLSEKNLESASGTMAMTADQRWFAAGDDSGAIRLWELTADHAVRVLEGHTEPVTDLIFSPDGSALYSGSLDKTVRCWNVMEGRLSGHVEAPVPVTAIALVNEATQIVTGGGDHVIRLWPVPQAGAQTAEGGQVAVENKPATPVREWSGHAGEIAALAVLPTASHQFISGSLDGTLRHWDANDGQEIRKLDHGAAITAVAVRRDGKRFVSLGEDQAAKLWNAEDGEQVAELKGDGRIQVQIATLDRSIQLATAEVAHYKDVNEAAKKEIGTTEDAFQKASEAQMAAEMEWMETIETARQTKQKKAATDEAVVAANATAKQATSARAAAAESVNQSAERLAQLEQNLQTIRKAAAKQPADEPLRAALAAVQQAIQEAKGKRNEIDQAVLAQFTAVQQAANQFVAEISQQAEMLGKQVKNADRAVKDSNKKHQDAVALVANTNRSIEQAQQKNAETKEELAAAERKLTQQQEQKNEMVQAAEASDAPILTVAFADDNRQLALGDQFHRIQLFDAETGNLFQLLAGHTAPIRAARFTADGHLVSMAADGKRIVWDLEPDWILERTIGHVDQREPLIDRVLALDFSPNGQLLATGSGEPSRSGQLKIWQVADGQMLQSFDDAHSDTIFAVNFSPQGHMLATAAADRMVKTFHVAEGKFVQGFDGHTHHALAVDWQANGRRLASAGADNVIKVWDRKTGEPQRTIDGYQQEVCSLSFLGIGAEAIATSGDGTIRLHNTDDGKEIRQFEGAQGFVYTAVASADGAVVAAGGRDSVLRIWSVRNGELRGAFAPPDSHEKIQP